MELTQLKASNTGIAAVPVTGLSMMKLVKGAILCHQVCVISHYKLVENCNFPVFTTGRVHLASRCTLHRSVHQHTEKKADFQTACNG